MRESMVSIVHFQPHGRRVEARAGNSLLEIAREAGISIESICGSAGKCGKCKVIITSGASILSPMTESEIKALRETTRAGTRLACQARVLADGSVTVEIPEESRREHHRLLAKGVEPRISLDPAVSKVLLKIPPATLKDVRADDDRLLQMLFKKARIKSSISPGVHRDLPNALRRESWLATVTLFREKELIRIDPGDTTGSLYGIAVDIGTTKLVAYLLNLRTGDIVGTESMPNPQIPFGEDLMSRISYTIKNRDGLAILQKAVVDGINSLVSNLCIASSIDPTDVLEVSVVGNTAMHHIFFGIPTQHLAAAPYAPAVRTSISVNPTHLGLSVYPFGKVSALPNIAGFVGADAVADLISSGLYKDRQKGMMIDIGTNTEVIAGNRDRLVCCSCASGPAFEGAHIKFGMRAATGAIERVWIDAETKDVRITTIDDSPAMGICGSGIVDAVSEMLNAGLIDGSGKIGQSGDSRRIKVNPTGPPEFVLVFAKETGTGQDITITQHDIQEIQLAKAAIFTGVSMLMRRLKLRGSDLKRIYAAGAFGTYVDASSAINIGMYPDVPVDRIKFIGNAAGSGARMALKSVRIRDLAERLSKKVEYVELAAEKDFQTEFAKAMFLPHRDNDRFPNHGKLRQQ